VPLKDITLLLNIQEIKIKLLGKQFDELSEQEEAILYELLAY